MNLPPNSSKTESWGRWSGAQERPLGYIAAKKTVGHLLGGACSAQSQETRSDRRPAFNKRTPSVFSPNCS